MEGKLGICSKMIKIIRASSGQKTDGGKLSIEKQRRAWQLQ